MAAAIRMDWMSTIRRSYCELASSPVVETVMNFALAGACFLFLYPILTDPAGAKLTPE